MTAPANAVANIMANVAINNPANANNSAQSADAADLAIAGQEAGTPTLSFAALVKQIASRSLSGQTVPELVITPDNSEKVSAGETAVDLNALLPFLEGLGLTGKERSLDTESLLVAEEATSDESLPASLAAPVPEMLSTIPVAVPITVPVAPTTVGENYDTAVETTTAALSAPATTSGAALDTAAETTIPAIPAASLPVVEASALTPADPAAAIADTAPPRPPDTMANGENKEFAANLKSAIESVPLQGGGTNTPGSVATVVQQIVHNLNAPSAQAAAPQMTISPAMGTGEWGDAVGQRIVWMANHAEGRAELVLTPPQMGRVEVSLAVNGDQATAAFVSANPAVRDALEAALPRLREILADAGIQLNQAQVGAENTRQSAQQDKKPDNFGLDRQAPAGTTSEHDSQPGVLASSRGLKIGYGLVDVFA